MRVVVSIGLAVSEAHSRKSICRAPASMQGLHLGRRLAPITTSKNSTTHTQQTAWFKATAECSFGSDQAG
jgi:hypothetical protein